MATSGPPPQSSPGSSSSSLSQESADLERVIDGMTSLSLESRAKSPSRRFSIFGRNRSQSRIGSPPNGSTKVQSTDIIPPAAAAAAAAPPLTSDTIITPAMTARASGSTLSSAPSPSRTTLLSDISKQSKIMKKKGEDIRDNVRKQLRILSQVKSHSFKKELPRETHDLKTTLETLCFLVDEEYTQIIGLCEQFSFHEIVNAIKEVQISPTMQLHFIQMLGDLIAVDRFNGEEFLSDNFCESFAFLFIPHGDIYRPLFEELVAAKKESNRLQEMLQILDARFISGSLEKTESLFPKVLDEKRFGELAKCIGNELRALDLAFYRQLKVTEFRKIAWKKENKERTSPTLLNQLALSNKISGFFIHKILTSSDEQRVLLVKLMITLMQNLTEEKPYDLDAVMAVSAALDHNSVNRLKLVEALPDKYKKTLSKITELLSNGHNYKSLRAKTFPTTTIPFLGVFLRDLVFASEGNNKSINNLCASTGEVYATIFSHLDALREREDILPQTQFGEYLKTLPALDERDDELMALSYQIIPRRTTTLNETSLPRTLTPTYDLSRFSNAGTPAAAAAAAASPAAHTNGTSVSTGPAAPHTPSQPLTQDVASSSANGDKDKSKRKSTKGGGGLSFIKWS